MDPPVLAQHGLYLGERLGQGSYATCNKAYNRVCRSNGTREVFAVKCVQKLKVCETRMAQDNLIREIEILRKLRHPHIVQLIDFLWDNENIYLIMEYCNCGDLSQFIRKQYQQQPRPASAEPANRQENSRPTFNLPEPLVRKFLQQLASAVKYLRSKQISHMDLKPQNILISSNASEGVVLKLGDFGFATVLKYGDHVTSLRGSPLYMAPEILKKGQYDARVDLWSIGVIMYECLFGKAPFACDNLEDLIERITCDDPIEIPRKPVLSNSCRSLLVDLLKRDPRDRLTFIEFFTHPFIDPDYSPSQESQRLAERLEKEAADVEKDGYTVNAIKLYCEALDYYLSALQYAKSAEDRQALRLVVKRVLSRAELLKSVMNPVKKIEETTAVGETSASTNTNNDEAEELKRLWNEDRPQVEAAVVLRNYAENLLQQSSTGTQSNLDEALNKYQLAIESMLKVLADDQNETSEQKKRRRTLLKKFVNQWLNRAEEIRDFLTVKNLALSNIEEKEKTADVSFMNIEETVRKMAQENNCSLQ